MPSLPVVSGAETVRALQNLGFSIVRQRGSLRKGSQGCVVPNHRQIKTGTLAGFLNKAVFPSMILSMHSIHKARRAD